MILWSSARSILAALTICLLGTTAAAETRELAALRAARAWLAAVDAGNYDGSWRAAAGYFQTAMSEEQWRLAMDGVRRPLGLLLAREVGSQTYATELPGVPDGEYVVIQFNSSFENKRSAVETVIPMVDDDGAWRVAGYLIK